MLKNPFLCASALTTLLIAASTLHATDVFVEGKAAYFHPTSSKFRKIYGGGGMYGGELTCQVWKGLYAWGSTSSFRANGKSIGELGGSFTKVSLIPIALGLKYLFPIDRFDIYLGAGATFTHIHFTDNSPFVIRHSSKWGYGGIAKAGVLVNINKYLFLDIFSDYSYLKMRFHNTDGGRVVRPNLDLSGLSVGVAIGLRWGRPNSQSEL